MRATLKSSLNLESFMYKWPSTRMRFSMVSIVEALSLGVSFSLSNEFSSSVRTLKKHFMLT